MSASVDFVLESPSTNATLLVEAKSINSPSPEWAARLARSLVADVPPDAHSSLLLVLRNHLYLWKRIPQEDAEPPDFSGRTEDVFRPYLQHVQTPLQDISGLSFEFLVKSWLTDLSEGSIPPSVAVWVREAGLQEFEHGVLREEQRN